jgi:hypothetical protein
MDDELFSVDDGQPFTKCPYCDRRIEPHEPGAVYAVEQREVLAFGPTRELVDGMGGWFHAGCSPEAVGYARRDAPLS